MSDDKGHLLFTDMHTHILPGVDDGAPTAEKAVELLRMAMEDGTGEIIFTPHFREPFRDNTRDKLKAVFSDFQKQVKELLPDIQLHLGCEVHYQADVGNLLASGQVLTMCDSDYPLLEFRYGALASQIEAAVSEVCCHGFMPIIAHAERYDALRNDRRLIDKLTAQGALVQLNADSIMGKHGFGVKRYCQYLLKSGRVQFIASDAHDAVHRPPRLQECYQYVCRKYGEDYAAELFWENARTVIDNGVF